MNRPKAAGPLPTGTLVTGFPLASTTVTSSLSRQATYTRVPPGSTLTPIGPELTFTVASTVFSVGLPAAMSMIDSVLSALLATYARVPAGLTSSPQG